MNTGFFDSAPAVETALSAIHLRESGERHGQFSGVAAVAEKHDRQGILDAVLNLFGEESVGVMWKDTSGLSETELADLGFCKIAGSELIYRHSALRTPFYDAHPTGQNTDDAVAEPEDEEWVMQEWKRFQGVIP